MKTSAAGIALIKRNEGCRLEAYTDITGVWTIGFGDTLNVRPGMTITQQDAEERLVTRLANEFEPAVADAIGSTPTTQAQFDAMVSLAWNIGPAAFKKSTVAREHRAGNYQAAADAFRLWTQAGGRYVAALAKRREKERALYLSAAQPYPGPTPPAPDEPDEIPDGAIMSVQLGLRLAGDYDGPIDGIAGKDTKAGLQAFIGRL